MICRTRPDHILSSDLDSQLEITDEYRHGMSDHNLLIVTSKGRIEAATQSTKKGTKTKFKKLKEEGMADRIWEHMKGNNFERDLGMAIEKGKKKNDFGRRRKHHDKQHKAKL